METSEASASGGTLRGIFGRARRTLPMSVVHLNARIAMTERLTHRSVWSTIANCLLRRSIATTRTCTRVLDSCLSIRAFARSHLTVRRQNASLVLRRSHSEMCVRDTHFYSTIDTVSLNPFTSLHISVAAIVTTIPWRGMPRIRRPACLVLHARQIFFNWYFVLALSISKNGRSFRHRTMQSWLKKNYIYSSIFFFLHFSIIFSIFFLCTEDSLSLSYLALLNQLLL